LKLSVVANGAKETLVTDTERSAIGDHSTGLAGGAAGRQLRADARRNRARVLEAAEAAFASKGTSVSTEEIARDAGVGIGTVFRHFPTKEALLEAVYIARLRNLAEEAEALVSADDPGAAFFAFFARVVGHAATKNALTAALTEAGVDVQETVAETGRELKSALAALLTRAQGAGAIRDDVGLPEVMTLLVGASQAAEHVGAGYPGQALGPIAPHSGHWDSRIVSTKSTRSKPGRKWPSTSALTVPNTESGRCAIPSVKARRISRLKSGRGCSAVTCARSSSETSS
jgi:AcrR family transcriptional regulator